MTPSRLPTRTLSWHVLLADVYTLARACHADPRTNVVQIGERAYADLVCERWDSLDLAGAFTRKPYQLRRQSFDFVRGFRIEVTGDNRDVAVIGVGE